MDEAEKHPEKTITWAEAKARLKTLLR
jgi:hypothetical protein